MARFVSSLRFRLLLLVLLALIPSFALITYTASEQQQRTAAQAQRDALRLARAAAGSQEQLIATAGQLLAVLAQFPAVRDHDPGTCPTLLAKLKAQYPYFNALGVTDSGGNLVCSTISPEAPANIGDDSFVPAVLKSRELRAGEYKRSPISGRAIIGFGSPMLDDSGNAQGVVFAVVNLNLINDMAAQVLLPPGSTLSMRDRNGTIVARYPDPEQWLGHSRPETSVGQIAWRAQAEETVQAVGSDGVRRLYASTPLTGLPQGDLYVSIGIPLTVAFAEVNQTLQRDLIALGLVGLLAVAAAWFGGDWFLLRHVNALSAVTSRLADGDLTVRTGLRYGVGELGQLARSFDRMVGKLEQREAEREQAEAQARRWSTRLEKLIHTSAQAMSQPRDAVEIMDTALHGILEGMDYAVGCVILKRESRFALVASSGLSGAAQATIRQGVESEDAAPGLCDLAWKGVRPVVDDPLARVLTCGTPEFPEWLAVPIRSQGGPLGLVCLAGADQRPIQAQAQAVLAAIGQELGVAIENANLYQELRTMAALKERERISHELHDGLVQLLGYLALCTENAKDSISADQPHRATAQLQEMQAAVIEANSELRESILGLRTTVSPDGGLIPALDKYVDRFRLRTGIRVEMMSSDEAGTRYAPEAEMQLLPIIQEALTNVRKHSGASLVTIRFESQMESITATIRDDGRGFDPAQATRAGCCHLGLSSMRERTQDAGGSFDIQSAPGQGTTVVVTLPNTGKR